MLSFLLDNEPLILDEDTSVQIVRNNPACNFQSYPGDVGLGISIPAVGQNRAKFGNPERFERAASQNDREFENFEIRFSGALEMGGTLIIESANEERYTGWLRSDVGNIAEEHREKFIYDSISFNEERIFENKANYDPESDDYGCPQVYNPDFFKEKGEKTIIQRRKQNPNYGKWIWKNFLHYAQDQRQYIYEEEETEDLTEAFMRNAGWMVNKKNGDGTIKTPDTIAEDDPQNIIDNLEVTAVSPMLFLNYVLKSLLKDAGFGLRNNFIADDDDLKKLLVYNNFDITEIGHLTEKVEAVQSKYWDMFVDDSFVSYESPVQSMGWTVEHITRKVNAFYYKDLLPKVKLKDWILSTQNNLNLFLHFVPGRKIVDIIDRDAILDEEAIDIDKYLLGFWEIDQKNKLTLKFSFDHDSNDMVFSQQWEDISDYRDNEKEPVDTWDDLIAIEEPDTDEIRFVREANGYAQYKLWLLESTDADGEKQQEKYIGWQLLTIGFQNAFFNYGQKDREEIKTKFSTLAADQNGLPNTRQKGNIRSELFAFETFSPRLLFYKGNNDAGYETDTLSLDWEKETKGLLAKRWKNWPRFWATRQNVKTEAHFPLAVLDFMAHNIYKKYSCEDGEFIIEKMKTEFRLSEIGKTQIDGYKLNYAPKTYNLDEMWLLNDIIWIDETVNMDGLEKYFPLIVF